MVIPKQPNFKLDWATTSTESLGTCNGRRLTPCRTSVHRSQVAKTCRAYEGNKNVPWSSITEIVRSTPLGPSVSVGSSGWPTLIGLGSPTSAHLPMLVLLLALPMQGNLRQLYESATSTAENVDASAPPF